MTPYIFTDLPVMVSFAKARGQRGFYDGRESLENMRLIELCTHILKLSPHLGCSVIYTRDIGHHSSGWWKNPDYERCLHLSLSFREWRTGKPVGYDKKHGQEIAIAFFGNDAAKCWVEPPYSDRGKKLAVYHHRLFCNAGWNPILPKGEVYSKERTPADWKSFSEIYGWSPKKEQAPFLLNAT